ncbi:DUF2637 domain-containing protein (plasmid) [Streptomyces sp. NBC_00637]|uniref:DUF2637 domain-containing protein n=1 Tax=Streptomyces sp. NBC_00637 TaxID=2903667 RepID=UPI003245788D
MEHKPGRVVLSRVQRILVAIVITGALVIAAIGFSGSYAAVRDLAERKGFGEFAQVFPIGVDAGIAVLLALDLLLTWVRIPFPMLRQTAWLLTVATIAFNAAAAWPDPIGVGMHAVIPILFVVTVEAARHAVGRLAAITADRHIEGVRVWRWLLAPLPTFLLWRRMMLWEIRRYDDVIHAEQQRLVYQARLRSRFGRRWRSKAPVEQLLPLRIARFGVPLDEAARSLQRSAHPSLEPARPAEETEPAEPVMDTAALPGPHSAPPEEELPPSAPSHSPPAERGEADEAPHATPTAADGAQGTSSSDPQPAPERPETGPDPSPSDNTPREPDPATTTTPGDHQETAADPSDVHGPDDEPNAPPAQAEQEDEAQPGEEAPQDEAPPTDEETETEPAPEPDPEHVRAVAALKTNAEAVRYAMRILNTSSTPRVVDWLGVHGRVVNRGQAHKITQGPQPPQTQHLKVVQKAS